METERELAMMLEAVKMNPKFHQQLLKNVVFEIMMGVYPEYEETQRKTRRKDMGLEHLDKQSVSDVDYVAEKQDLDFVEKMTELGSLDAIKQYCNEHHTIEYYLADIADYITYTYEEIQKIPQR